MRLHTLVLNRRHACILGCFLAAALAAPGAASAQDPVEKLRQALLLQPVETKAEIDITPNPARAARRAKLIKEIEDRRLATIKAVLPEIKTIAHLRQAYFLKEWLPHGKLDRLEKAVHIEDYRVKIGEQFLKAVKQAASEPDPTRQLPTLAFIAALADGPQAIEREGKGKFARAFTDVVKNLTTHKDLLIKQSALNALGKITPPPAVAIPVLHDTLKNDSVGPRRLAAYALTDLVKNATFLKLTEDDRMAKAANEELHTINLAIRAAADGLNDGDERVRGYCLQTIVEAGRALTDYVVASAEDDIAVEDKDTLVINKDVNAILKTIQTANPRVLERFHDPRINIRLTALQAMDQISMARAQLIQSLLGRAPLVPALQKLIPDQRDSIPELITAVGGTDPLGNIAMGDWKIVGKLLRDEDVRIRRGGIEILAQLGPQAEPAMDEILFALRDPDRSVRSSAVRTLRQIAPKKVSGSAVRALSRLLSDPDPDISAAAADALGSLGSHGAEGIDGLIYAVAEGDVENRTKAMHALVQIGGAPAQRAIPKLITVLTDPEVRMRRAAAETLGKFGPAARDAVPALREALRDDDAEVRLNASESILSITVSRKDL